MTAKSDSTLNPSNRLPEGWFSWKPTPEQELLLRACLLPREIALESWKRWKAVADIDSLDTGSQRLLPLLYHNLKTHNVSEDIDPRLKGAYRETWYKNQLLFHRAGKVIERFHEAGIDTLVFKGPTLTTLYYRDMGLRPMNDFDLLIKREKVEASLDIFNLLGWRPQKDARSLVEYHNAISMVNLETQSELDLHWFAFQECPREGFDDELWERSTTVDLHGIHTRALDPTDELLYVCLHGSRENRVPPIRWVADAYTILRTSGRSIDWDRIAAIAVRERIIIPLKMTLGYLATYDHKLVGENFLSSLGRPVIMERIEQWSSVSPVSFLKSFLRRWFFFLRTEKESPLLLKLMRFPRHLQGLWGVDRLWELPFVLVKKIRGRVWKASISSVGPR